MTPPSDIKAEAREDIISAIRRAQCKESPPATDTRPPSSNFARGLAGQAPSLSALFIQKLEAHSATVSQHTHIDEVPETLCNAFPEGASPLSVRVGSDPFLASMSWATAPSLEVLQGAASPDDPVSLSHAFAAAAETGTLFLLSGPENPTTLNFLCPVHMVVIRRQNIFFSYEEVWEKMRKTLPHEEWPRSVNLISGPSRTADIEQTIILGAHGPERLHVMIID